jgi:hypothetical protein
MPHTIETLRTSSLEAPPGARGFAIFRIAQTIIAAVLIALCLKTKVVAYVAWYGQQEIFTLIAIILPDTEQQTLLPKDDAPVRLKQVVASANRDDLPGTIMGPSSILHVFQ